MMRTISLALLLTMTAQPAGPAFLSEAGAGLKTLQTWYIPETGLWRTTGWWNAGNAVTVLSRYTALSRSKEFRSAIAKTFELNSHGKFLNQYYDDEGWWALAWIDTYAWSHDARYLNMAEQIFSDMTTGWDDTCGGGIWWKKDRHYKNAIANELFLSVAANLATVSRDPKQRASSADWAKREWQWFASSGMINSRNLVNDGLTSACQNNQRNTWSYNQGVILGGLAALSKLESDPKLLETAHAIAAAAITHLSDPAGILHDTCEPKCGADGVQFKGIFARNLAILNSAAPDPQYRTFLETNAASIWRNQDAEHRFGVVWSGPSEVNAAAQVSAVDALVAAAQAAKVRKK